MGDLTICPSSDVGASPGVEPGAEAAAGAETKAVGAVRGGAAGGGASTMPSFPPEPPFTIFTFSSPSVISSSAIPDSSTRSISFFNLRKSMLPSFRSGHQRPFPRGFDSENFQFERKANCSANSYARLPRPQIVPTAMSEKYEWRRNDSLLG